MIPARIIVTETPTDIQRVKFHTLTNMTHARSMDLRKQLHLRGAHAEQCPLLALFRFVYPQQRLIAILCSVYTGLTQTVDTSINPTSYT